MSELIKKLLQREISEHIISMDEEYPSSFYCKKSAYYC